MRTVALMFIVLIYLMFGAAVFNTRKHRFLVEKKKRKFLCFLVESKEESTIRNQLRIRMARIIFKSDKILDETVLNSVTAKIFDSRNIRNGTTKQWTFPGAFYFSTLVVTLIGKIENFFSIRETNGNGFCFRLRSHGAENRSVEKKTKFIGRSLIDV